MRKILLIYTGGTFGMVPLASGKMLAPGDLTDSITHYLPAINSIADISIEIIYNLDSSNIHIPHWIKLAHLIEKNIDDFDGFVVIHGTDAMVYTATALSFMLNNLPKPVIFTGSQRPIAALRTDARSNLINAIEIAGYDIPEVAIVFDELLLRANRTIKGSSTNFSAFFSPNFPPLAEIGLDIDIKENYRKNEGLFNVQTKFDDRVLITTVFPGLRPDYLESILNTDIKGIVIEAFGLGNVPIMDKSLIPFIKSATELEKIVVIASQVPHGYVDLKRYDCGDKARQAGAISAFDMTTPAAIVKLMFLLGQVSNHDAVVRAYQTPIVGEMYNQEHEHN